MMKKIIRKILKEDQREMYLNKIVHVMKNDFPLFKNMDLYGFYDQLSEEELIYVLSGVFGEPVIIGKSVADIVSNVKGKNIYNNDGYIIYYENSRGDWVKREYDEYENMISFETSDGKWWKKEYDENGNMMYYENSDGEIVDHR